MVAADAEVVHAFVVGGQRERRASTNRSGAHRACGFSQTDIYIHLESLPVGDGARYLLRFADDRLIAQVAYGDQPFQTLDTGTFVISDNGFQISVPEVQGACEPLAAAEIDGSRLILNLLELPGCETDERVVSTLLLDIPSYSRADD